MKLRNLLLVVLNVGVFAQFSQCEEIISERFMNGKVFYHVKNNSKDFITDSFGDDVTIKWFNQTLDHFSPSDTRTWLQVGFNVHSN